MDDERMFSKREVAFLACILVGAGIGAAGVWIPDGVAKYIAFALGAVVFLIGVLGVLGRDTLVGWKKALERLAGRKEHFFVPTRLTEDNQVEVYMPVPGSDHAVDAK